MAQMSHLGVFAFYVNAMMACGFDVGWLYIPKYKGEKLVALMSLLLFALVAMIAGKMVTSLTHQIYHESVQEGTTEKLLLHPMEERNPDIDLPSVIFEVFKTRTCGKFLSFVVLVCCASIILAVCVKTTALIAYPAYFLFEEKNLFIAICILGAAVIISILNKYNEAQLEKIHIVLMFCRFAAAFLSRVFIEKGLPREFANLPHIDIMLGLFSLLSYQITIPSIANISQQSKQTHYCMQKLAIAATLCCYIWLLYCPSFNWIKKSQTYVIPFVVYMKIVDLVYLMSLVVNIQTYWKVMLGMLKMWIFREEDKPVALSYIKVAITTVLHWPIQIISTIFIADNIIFIMKLIGVAVIIDKIASFVLVIAITIVFLCRKGRMKCRLIIGYQFCIASLVLIVAGYTILSSGLNVLTIVLGMSFGFAIVVVIVVLLFRRFR